MGWTRRLERVLLGGTDADRGLMRRPRLDKARRMAWGDAHWRKWTTEWRIGTEGRVGGIGGKSPLPPLIADRTPLQTEMKRAWDAGNA